MRKVYAAVLTAIIAINLSAQIHLGSSQTYPNIQAAAPFIQPGDTVYLHAGEFTGYNYYLGLHGTASQWITIRPYASDIPVIRGFWQFSNLEYVHFKDLTFQGNATYTSGFMNIDNAGDCATQSNNIKIENCYFGDNLTGNTLKFGGVDDFEIVNCTFKNQGNGSDGNAGFAMNVCHNGWVHDNLFENVQGRAIQTKLGTTNILFERNLVKNCGTIDVALRIGEAGGLNFHCLGDDWTARKIKVHSNVIIGGRASFSLGQGQNCEFINNTFINPSQFVFRVLAEQIEFACDSNLIQNNIFYLTSTRYFNGSAGGTANNLDYTTHWLDHNLYYYTGDAAWVPNPSTGVYDMEEIAGVSLTNNISGDPKFVNANLGDYRLQSSSPAIGAGVVVTKPAADHDNMLFKNPPAVGAYEYNSVPALVFNSSKKQNNELQWYLTPSNDVLFVITPEDFIRGELKLFTIEGKLLSSAHVQRKGELINVPISQLGAGVYVLSLSSEGRVATQKVTITK